jgi:hypothetical protein
VKSVVGTALLVVLLGAGACMNEGKIDTTNQTLAQSLDELKTLNKNMLAASDRLSKDLGEPVKEMAKGFTRVADAFEANMDATQNILKLVQAIRPEEFELVHAQFLQASDAFAAFTKRLAEEGTDLETLGAQSASVLKVIGSLAPLISQVSSPHRGEGEASVEDVGTSGARLGEATSAAAVQGADALGPLMAKLAAQPGAMGEAVQQLDRLRGDVHRLAQIAPSLQELLDGTDFKEVMEQLPALATLRTDVEKALANFQTDRVEVNKALVQIRQDRTEGQKWWEELRKEWNGSRAKTLLGLELPPFPSDRKVDTP